MHQYCIQTNKRFRFYPNIYVPSGDRQRNCSELIKAGGREVGFNIYNCFKQRTFKMISRWNLLMISFNRFHSFSSMILHSTSPNFQSRSFIFCMTRLSYIIPIISINKIICAAAGRDNRLVGKHAQICSKEVLYRALTFRIFNSICNRSALV